jgi:hypothetical protein
MAASSCLDEEVSVEVTIIFFDLIPLALALALEVKVEVEDDLQFDDERCSSSRSKQSRWINNYWVDKEQIDPPLSWSQKNFLCSRVEK